MSRPDPLRYVVRKRRQYWWRPKGGADDRMRALGFRPVKLGPELNPTAIAQAAALNAEWDRLRREFPKDAPAIAQAKPSRYRPGSIGYAMEQTLGLRAAKREHAGKAWDKAQQTRDDWMRALKRFADAELDIAVPRRSRPRSSSE